MGETSETPTTFRDVVAYCWTVLKRALREFFDAFGWNKTTLVGILIYIAVLAWRYRIKGLPIVMEEFRTWQTYIAEAVPATLIVAGL
jgi:hypothetical protein